MLGLEQLHVCGDSWLRVIAAWGPVEVLHVLILHAISQSAQQVIDWLLWGDSAEGRCLFFSTGRRAVQPGQAKLPCW